MRLALVALAAGCLATAVHADGVAPDGAGGIYVAHSVTLGQQVGLAVEHFRGDGSRAPGYETPRFIAHNSTYAPSYIAADDRGGAYALVFTGGDVVATRFDDALAPASGWPASGLLADSRALGSYGVLVPDGQGGMFGAWEKIPAKVSVRRFLSTGVFAPGWADTTIAAAPTEQFQVGPAMVADGTGDVLVAWSDYVNPGLWGQRIAADGTRLWSDNGRPIVIDP